LEYKKPLIVLNPNGEWDSFVSRTPTVKTIADAVEKI